MHITGSTQVYAIVADPIAQVRAPEVFNEIFGRAGIDAVMIPLHVRAPDLDALSRTLFSAPNLSGLVVSIPHKSALAVSLGSVDRLASVAGAVNAVRRGRDGQLEGALFDGEGFVLGLEADGLIYRGRHALILGAGGAGAAIATSLAQRGAASIALFDPEWHKAEDLGARVQATFGVPCHSVANNSPAGYGLVVNATPLGLRTDDPLPFNPAELDPGAVVCDILMKNQPTPLLRTVRALGGVAQPGFEMLIQQMPLYLEFFGHHKAAQQIRDDPVSLRELLYPQALRDSWAQA